MDFKTLSTHIQNVQNALQEQAIHAVNTALTARSWIIGCYIVEYEQHGEDRAAYGQYLFKNLEKSLNSKGLTARNLRRYRLFYSAYPQLLPVVRQYLVDNFPVRPAALSELTEGFQSAVESELQLVENEFHSLLKPVVPPERIFYRIPYTHLMMLSSIDDELKRTFYEVEIIRGCWSIRELERQINSCYYERCGLSKNKEALAAIADNKAQKLIPQDIINSPFALEFLGLTPRDIVTEDDLEKAILDHLQDFLLELGHGFCFEGRQKRMLIDDEYFKVDMVFYHRILKCHLIVDLKIDKFRHEHASQMNLYLNYFKNEIMQPDDNPPIGLLLCSDHGHTLVQYATAGLDPNIFVRKYRVQLPSEEEIVNYLNSRIL